MWKHAGSQAARNPAFSASMLLTAQSHRPHYLHETHRDGRVPPAHRLDDPFGPRRAARAAVVLVVHQRRPTLTGCRDDVAFQRCERRRGSPVDDRGPRERRRASMYRIRAVGCPGRARPGQATMTRPRHSVQRPAMSWPPSAWTSAPTASPAAPAARQPGHRPLHITSALLSGRTSDAAPTATRACVITVGPARRRASCSHGSCCRRDARPSRTPCDAQVRQMLDIGTGTAALAVGYAETFRNCRSSASMYRGAGPATEPPRPSPPAQRPTASAYRRQDVAEFADDDGFDLAWFPAPFIPPPVARQAASRRGGTPAGRFASSSVMAGSARTHRRRDVSIASRRSPSWHHARRRGRAGVASRSRPHRRRAHFPRRQAPRRLSIGRRRAAQRRFHSMTAALSSGLGRSRVTIHENSWDAFLGSIIRSVLVGLSRRDEVDPAGAPVLGVFGDPAGRSQSFVHLRALCSDHGRFRP